MGKEATGLPRKSSTPGRLPGQDPPHPRGGDLDPTGDGRALKRQCQEESNRGLPFPADESRLQRPQEVDEAAMRREIGVDCDLLRGRRPDDQQAVLELDGPVASGTQGAWER